MDFTTWSDFTAVKNHLALKTIFDLVETHIGFAHIRPPKVVLTLIGGFSGFYRLVEFYRGRKPPGWKVHIQFSGKAYRVRQYPTINEGLYPFPIDFTYVQFFRWVLPAG